jgi:ribosomal protein L40E
MSAPTTGRGGRHDIFVALILGIFTSFLTLLIVAITIQVLDASESIFAVRTLFLYLFIPLMLQGAIVSGYVRGGVGSLFIPLISTIVGTAAFLAIMFLPSVPTAAVYRTIYNSIIASLMGGVIGFAFAGTRMRERAEAMGHKVAPKTCWACGSTVPPTAFFCERCGERVR